SSRPQRASAATPGGCTTCVDTTSLGNIARSTISTRYPLRAKSMPVGEPAQRAPMMMASYGFMTSCSSWIQLQLVTRGDCEPEPVLESIAAACQAIWRDRPLERRGHNVSSGCLDGENGKTS